MTRQRPLIIFPDANILFSAAYGSQALERLWDEFEVKKIDDPLFSLDNRSHLSVMIDQGIITMKKTILPFLMLLISLLLPAVSDASYIIHLENGGQLLTPQYWEEDNYVKFYIVGGMMGIEKNSVRKIERSTIDLNGIYEVKKPEKRAVKSEAEPQSSILNVPKIDAQEAVKKDPTVMQEFNTLEKKFESRKRMTVDELNVLKNDLTALRDKIVSNHSEEDFREEVDKIADMRFFTNDLIIVKSRSR